MKRGAAALLLLAVAGCAGGTRSSMVRIPPPRDWAPQLQSLRSAKDAAFRSDPHTPLRAADLAGFAGLEYWAPDARFYFAGPIEWYAQPQRLELPSTAGGMRPGEKVGRIEFELEGRVRSLEVFRLLDVGESQSVESLFLPFSDATAGVDTYPAGRYLELQGLPGGPYVLDFNRAYNPSCAYGDPARFACPMAPPGNRLDVRIEAGERGYKRAA